MSSRGTYASVTDAACTCKYLERAADDPDNPITFDERTGEYQFIYQESEVSRLATLSIYHCPFCGGTTPPSKRPLLFHTISRGERERLADLLRPLQSLEEVISALGPPASDAPQGMATMEHEKDSSPPTVEFSRTLTYRNLSDVAEVCVHIRPDGTVGFSLSGKQKCLE